MNESDFMPPSDDAWVPQPPSDEVLWVRFKPSHVEHFPPDQRHKVQAGPSLTKVFPWSRQDSEWVRLRDFQATRTK